ncbi:glycosyltransferase family 1 protein [Thiospirochaeta perfilievii]|uniref:Glycosyltransferase family 1 protein n=1 Tax=Thiospirochaeta perfilievii TaxID=252967 RepID=A0A5C1QF53_9SPIO|nr:glycosyltransferase family 4 protein [Thiospirochaeta perfilievii]QEN05679.1 glycosyltransferase family 1 protein [Thiospirochaeta perfilievii]
MNIIYHIPWEIKVGRKSATGIRPLEMLEAFKNLGCNVYTVMGSGHDRKVAIRSIKTLINSGVKFDFVYSESSTAPTFIASGWKDFLKYGSLDLKFLKYCRKNGLKLGLFYRDIYWRYPEYMEEIPFLKRIILQLTYRLDLIWYKKWVTNLYLPSVKMSRLLGKYSFNVKGLPPAGSEIDYIDNLNNKKQDLNLFYVGGTNENYKLHKLFKIVSNKIGTKLRYCTRKDEWNIVSSQYKSGSNIEVIHKSGKELKEELINADIGMLFFETDEYRTFAMPVKMFEYLSYGIPVIATEGTAAGDWVKKNGVGWTIPYSEEALDNLLNNLIENPNQIVNTKKNISNVLKDNLWSSRAEQVIKDLR